jgi:hypothetical protein
MLTDHDKFLKELEAGGWLTPVPDPATPQGRAVENRVWRLIAGLITALLAVLGLVYAYLCSAPAQDLDLRALGRLVGVRRFYANPPADLSGRQTVLAIGDSITVGSIDCVLLDELLGLRYISYNLATPGKTHSEYLLDVQEPLVHDSIVVTLVNPGAIFAEQAVRLEERRANLIRVLDYPLERERWLAYDALVPESGVQHLLEPKFIHVWESRWRIEDSAGTWLQVRSPTTKPETKELLTYQRQIYARNLKRAELPLVTSEAEREAAIADRASKDPGLYSPFYAPKEDAVASWDFALHELGSAARSVLLVVAPCSPQQRERLGQTGLDEFRRRIDAYASDKVRVLDLSELLDDSGFRDEIHPGTAGRDAITRAVAAELLEGKGGASGEAAAHAR